MIRLREIKCLRVFASWWDDDPDTEDVTRLDQSQTRHAMYWPMREQRVSVMTWPTPGVTSLASSVKIKTSFAHERENLACSNRMQHIHYPLQYPSCSDPRLQEETGRGMQQHYDHNWFEKSTLIAWGWMLLSSKINNTCPDCFVKDDLNDYCITMKLLVLLIKFFNL